MHRRFLLHGGRCVDFVYVCLCVRFRLNFEAQRSAFLNFIIAQTFQFEVRRLQQHRRHDHDAHVRALFGGSDRGAFFVE